MNHLIADWQLPIGDKTVRIIIAAPEVDAKFSKEDVDCLCEFLHIAKRRSESIPVGEIAK